VSANGKNGDLIQILNCFDPIFTTNDTLVAGYFTAKLFPDVEVLIDEDPFPEEDEQDAASCNLANIVNKFAGNFKDDDGNNAISSGSQQDQNSGAVAVIIAQDGNQDLHTVKDDAAIVNNSNNEQSNESEETSANANNDENGNGEAFATLLNQVDEAVLHVESEMVVDTSNII